MAELSEDKKRLEATSFQPGESKKIRKVGRSLSEIEEKLYMGDVMRVISPTQKRSLEFLKTELADGAKVPVAELQQKARAARIPIRSLTASRKMLNVRVSRVGQTGSFIWELQD
jgi:hypothetical protein